jgi:hypothetical protein
MREGWAGRAIEVRRAESNERVDDVFLPGGLELWDRERKRLTLLLDPGRIKRGLLPHEQRGYPLTEGEQIVIRIDAAWPDAEGRPLRAAAERRFRVGPSLHSRVEPSAWRWDVPKAHSRGALTVAFGRSLDYALVQSMLVVEDADGVRVPGDVVLGAGEEAWRFRPRVPWAASHYNLVVDPRLEDVAGNSVARVFDRDLHSRADDPPTAPVTTIPFVCR